MAERDPPETSGITHENLDWWSSEHPKKGARPYDRADATRCGAIYPENTKKQWP